MRKRLIINTNFFQKNGVFVAKNPSCLYLSAIKKPHKVKLTIAETIVKPLENDSPFSRPIGTHHKDHVQNLINRRIANEIKKEEAREKRQKAREAEKRNPPPFMGPKSLRKYFKRNDPFTFLEKVRWAKGIYCPECGYRHYTEIKAKTYKCMACSKTYTVLTDTIFEKRKLDTVEMFEGIVYDLLTQTSLTKLELSGYLEIGQTTAYELLTDLRKVGYNQSVFSLHVLPADMKYRILEIDIVHIDDGLNINRHICDKLTKKQIEARKLKILTICLRGGFARAFPLVDKNGNPLKTVTTEDIKHIILENIPEDIDLICTDGDSRFNFLNDFFPDIHFTVNHKERYSVLGIIHVQTAESMHSLEQNQQFKHGKNVDPKNKMNYINGIIFKRNTKHLNIYEKFMLVIANIFRAIEKKFENEDLKNENAKVINMNVNKILKIAA